MVQDLIAAGFEFVDHVAIAVTGWRATPASYP